MPLLGALHISANLSAEDAPVSLMLTALRRNTHVKIGHARDWSERNELSHDSNDFGSVCSRVNIVRGYK